MRYDTFTPPEKALAFAVRNARCLTQILVEESENHSKLREMDALSKEELISRQQRAYTIAQGYWNAIPADKELEKSYSPARVLNAANRQIDYAERLIKKTEKAEKAQEKKRDEMKSKARKNTRPHQNI